MTNNTTTPDLAAIRRALEYANREICTHEDVHRGGRIWTICDACGEKWADDEGGFKPSAWSALYDAAIAALTDHQPQPLQADVERVALAIAKVFAGPNFDPFIDPEVFDFADTMAQAAIAAMPSTETLTRELAEARAERDRLYYDGIHTCHDQWQRIACVLRRELAEARDGLEAQDKTMMALANKAMDLSAELTATKARLAEAVGIMQHYRKGALSLLRFAGEEFQAFLAKQEG